MLAELAVQAACSWPVTVQRGACSWHASITAEVRSAHTARYALHTQQDMLHACRAHCSRPAAPALHIFVAYTQLSSVPHTLSWSLTAAEGASQQRTKAGVGSSSWRRPSICSHSLRQLAVLQQSATWKLPLMMMQQAWKSATASAPATSCWALSGAWRCSWHTTSSAWSRHIAPRRCVTAAAPSCSHRAGWVCSRLSRAARSVA